jgi:hypothetical protein
MGVMDLRTVLVRLWILQIPVLEMPPKYSAFPAAKVLFALVLIQRHKFVAVFPDFLEAVALALVALVAPNVAVVSHSALRL